jgi:hypothetical protein
VVRGSEDIRAVGVVTLDAIHPLLKHGMMVGQLELSVDIEMTVEAGVGRAAGIDNEFSAAPPCLDVQAARAMAGFTSSSLTARDALNVESHMGAGGKDAREVGMTIEARFVTDKICSFDNRSGDLPGTYA